MGDAARAVILDAGYLYDLVLHRMLRDAIEGFDGAAPPEMFRGTRRVIRSDPSYDSHIDALKRRRVVTWQGLLVELRYLGRLREDPEMRPPREPFWSAWSALRDVLRIDTARVDTNAFSSGDLARLGPADLAVVALARELAPAKAEILTIDRTVAKLARAEGVLPMIVDEPSSPLP